jgi:hypothetical protein
MVTNPRLRDEKLANKHPKLERYFFEKYVASQLVNGVPALCDLKIH